jgi:hypothetical protein
MLFKILISKETLVLKKRKINLLTFIKLFLTKMRIKVNNSKI